MILPIKVIDLKYRFGFLSCIVRDRKLNLNILILHKACEWYQIPKVLFLLIKDCNIYSKQLRESKSFLPKVKIVNPSQSGYMTL